MFLKNRKTIIFTLSLVLITALFTSTVIFADTGSTTVFKPVESNEVIYNPYMGWAPGATGGPYQQPHKLVVAQSTWAALEPVKGSYDFDTFESRNKFSYWDSEGVKIILRINMDYPGGSSHIDMPKWLYDETNGDGQAYDIEWGKGFSPNYNNPKIIAYHKVLIAELAKRYDNDPRIAFIELGSIGHWGEWHTYNLGGGTGNIPFPKIEVTDQYVYPYLNEFKNKMLMMRRPYHLARDNKMGLYNDGFGDHTQTYNYFNDWIQNGYTWWLTNEYHPAMPDYWKYAPSGGELINYPGTIYLQDSTIGETLRQARDSHTSWLGPSCPAHLVPGNSYQKNMDALSKTMGYRFVLESVSHQSEAAAGSTLSVNMDWNNKGVAPFYFRWPLELSLIDSNGNVAVSGLTNEDIRTWLPGIKSVSHLLDIPSDLTPGTYTLAAAIIDPETGKPGINLAINGRNSDGRYLLSDVKVVSSTVTPTPDPTPTQTPEPTSTTKPTSTPEPTPTTTPVPTTEPYQLPEPWKLEDVGSPAISGSAFYDNGRFTVNGAGSDIWKNADQFAFMNKTINGDHSLEVKIISQTYTYDWAKAGLMYRESDAPDGKFAGLFITPSNTLALQWRDDTGSYAENYSIDTNARLPIYIKLVRSGDKFLAYTSNDGINWGSPVASHTVKMRSDIKTGLAVTSHNESRVNTAVFENLESSQNDNNEINLPEPWELEDVGSPAISGSASYDNGRFTINGAGSDIWKNADQFAFMNKQVYGSSSLEVRLLSQTYTYDWAKTGLMFRESNAPDSKFVGLFMTPSNTLALQWRDNTGSYAENYSINNNMKPPKYIKLVRRWNTFYAYVSDNGTDWGWPVARKTVYMRSDIKAGLAVTSHNVNKASTAVFENLE